MKKTLILLILLFSSLARGQFWVNPNQKPSHGFQIHWGNSSKDIVGCWLFNEGSGNKVFDLSGNGNNGTLIGTAQFSAGKFGSVIVLDGDSDLINAGTNDILSITGDMTILLWMASTAADEDTVVRRYVEVGGWEGYAVAFSRSTAGKFDIYTDTGGWDGNLNATTVHDGAWHQVALVGSGTSGTIYIDGRADGTWAYGAPSFITGQTFYIGASDDSAFFDGKIDHVMIWSRALSASEISQLYSNPFGFIEPSWNWVLYGGISAPAAGAPQVIFIN